MFLSIEGADSGQKVVGDGLVHKQRFHGVAGRITLSLRVVADGDGHREIGVFVDVRVADAVQVPNHGDGGFFFQACDETLAAAGNDDVHIAIGRNEGTDEGAVRGRGDLYGVGG